MWHFCAKAAGFVGSATGPFLQEPDRRPLSQCGALCWRQNDVCKDVLLITSREAGRWIIPKGWPMKGKTLLQAAEQEAWEEAGVRGTPNPASIGCYRYVKRSGSPSAVEVDVTVFPLQVFEERNDFPEYGQRDRLWTTPEDAARLVDNRSLSVLIASFV
ncbi:NUDIX hydrolase [Falsirhodobacter sp. 20TX0035]|uniref:NUDIX hydrolase n=1 Tax=Falsirhodobacter sp. 20TX0035 TaxID=3022019 RepID=UPI00232F8F8D|nr:NUDIX hydrolase [Falsirhodobacter sp. 20TX0035]MDB6454248.1 NUDIX hydrolase [Falsirhodobacter sp. 20TX0035]